MQGIRNWLVRWLGGLPPSAAGPAPVLPRPSRERRERSEALIERERIYSDLHDDIGAKLLTLVHTAENPAQADLARSILQDLRDIVSRERGGVEGTLLQVLAQIRDETEQRLTVLRNALKWEQAPDLPDPPLDESQALHLFRIVREAVSNAIRHGRATRIGIRLRASAGMLLMEVEDDGAGVAFVTTGSGMRNMRARAAQLHGTIRWNAAKLGGGMKVELQFPLTAPAGADRRSLTASG